MVVNPAVSLPPAILPAKPTSPPPTSPPELVSITNAWLSTFQSLLSSKDLSTLSNLFLKKSSYWRDLLCLSWNFHTFHGPEKISSFLATHPKGIRIKSISLDNTQPPPFVTPLDSNGDVLGIQAVLKIETDVGYGRGLVKLVQADDEGGEWKAFTLFTTLDGLTGVEEALGENGKRPNGVQHGTNKGRKSWKDMREEEVEFVNEEPTVLIIGAGQGGLTSAARLRMLGVKALIIDKNERVGDNWRKRYHQLTLHDPVYYDHLPYFPFPDNWPIFTPKDKLADWFEAYASFMELNVWMSSTVGASSYDEKTKKWSVEVKRMGSDGKEVIRTLHPKHIILATGHSGEPNMPSIPGMEKYKGSRLCHSSKFTGAEPNSAGKKIVIVGCCNSAHDIAQDFVESGAAEVTMIQRSSTFVLSSQSLMVMLKGLFEEGGPPTETADLNLQAIPIPVLKSLHVDLSEELAKIDAPILSGLSKAGFKLDKGPHSAGFYLKYMERGGGYYIDVGASPLIASGAIKIKQGQHPTQIHEHSIQFSDGTFLEADEIIFATGYANMKTTAEKIFGDAVSARGKQELSEVWGTDEEGELRGIWRRSGVEGFWFMGGNLGSSRWFSRLLALQIKAMEEGLMAYDDI